MQFPAAHSWAEVAYVDDLAILLKSPDNAMLVKHATHAADAVFSAARLRGLQLTLGEGKTELLWALHGTGKRSILTAVAENGGTVPVALSSPVQTVQLPVVLAYKHLGTWVQNNAKPLRAIRARVAAARQAWGPLLKPFLSKSCVLFSTKLRVFESLVLSRYMFNAHTWCQVSSSQLAEWAAGLRPMLFSLAKPFLRGKAPFAFDVETLCGICELPAPLDMLHLARLRYFKRLLHNCPAVLWHSLQATAENDGSWFQLLKSSFAWLCRFSSTSFGLHADTAFLDWCSFVAVDDRWKGRLRRAMASCRRYRHEHAKVVIWNTWFCQSLLQNNGVTSGLPDPPVLAERWQCLHCSDIFGSKRALAQHAVKQHGYKTLVKHYAYDGTCANCCRLFHSRARLCCHLRTATECLDRIRASFPPLPLQTMYSLEELDREHAREMRRQGWLATKAKVPVLRGSGPALPPADSPDAMMMRIKWVARQDGSECPALDGLAGWCVQPPSSVPADFVASDDTPDSGQDIVFVMHSANGTEHGDGGRFSMRGLAWLYARLHIKTLCFIHFFSGFRREGDLQHQIEQHHVQGIFHIFCISIDFCLQGCDSDLASARSREFWKHQICSGAVFGTGGGPPCETFSAARFLEGGPPPLRSYDEPVGLPSNSQKQWDQTALGTVLLHFLLEMLYYCAMAGGCGFLEHPAFPVWARAYRPASTWALPAVRLLKRLHCTSVVTLDQCVFSCAARKPTSLLLIRLPHLRSAVLQRGDAGRCFHPPRSHISLQGRNRDGSFRTSIAKIYPEPFNRVLAEAIIQFATATFDPGFCHDAVSEDVAQLDRTDFMPRCVVQPDYHRAL